jgi:hypothetical protein
MIYILIMSYALFKIGYRLKYFYFFRNRVCIYGNQNQ